MTTYQSDFASGVKNMPNPGDSQVVSVHLEFDLSAALAAGDVIEMGILPAGCVPVDWSVDTDKLDSNGTPTITFDVGILDAAGTAIDTGASSGGGKWATALTTGQAGGYVRNAATYANRVTADDSNDRTVALVIATGPATGETTGTVGMTLSYRSAYLGG